MVAALLLEELCPYCQRSRSRLDVIHMPGGAAICRECEQRHQEALEALATGEFNGECSECGLTAEQLREQKRVGPRGEMAVHYEDGRYRMLCLVCDWLYVPKRRELYKNTEFGDRLKL